MARLERNLKKRGKSDYDPHETGSDYARTDATIQAGVSPNVELILPRYKETALYVRISPALDPDDPQRNLLPLRAAGKEEDERGFNDAFVRLPACAVYVGVGDVKETFILGGPGAANKLARKRAPYNRFWRAVDAAYLAAGGGKERKNQRRRESGTGDAPKGWKPRWHRYFEGSERGGAALSPPKPLWFFQGAVYRNGNTTYFDEGKRTLPYGYGDDDPLVVGRLNKQAGDALEALLAMRRRVKGEDRGFRHDPIGVFDPDAGVVKGGQVLAVFNPKHNKKRFHPDALEGKMRYRTSWSGKPPLGAVWPYEVALLDQYKEEGETYRPDLDALATDAVFNKTCFFFDDAETGQKGILKIMSPEEQIDVMAVIIGADEPGLFAFGTQEMTELTRRDSVQAVLKKRRTFVDPAAGDDDEDEGDEDEGATKKAKAGKKGKAAKAGGKKGSVFDEEDEDEDEGGDEAAASDEDDDDDEDDAEEAKAAEDDEDDEDDEEDDEEDEEDEEEEEEDAADEDDEDDEEEEDDKDAADEDDEDDEEEEDDKDAAGDEDEDDEDDEDDEPAKKPAAKPAGGKAGKKGASPAQESDAAFFGTEEAGGKKGGGKKAAAAHAEEDEAAPDRGKKGGGKKAAAGAADKKKQEAELTRSAKAAQAAAERSQARKSGSAAPPKPAGSGGSARRRAGK